MLLLQLQGHRHKDDANAGDPADACERCTKTCGRSLPGCSHTCPLPCHPGPCSVCSAATIRACFCGKSQQQGTCHALSQVWLHIHLLIVQFVALKTILDDTSVRSPSQGSAAHIRYGSMYPPNSCRMLGDGVMYLNLVSWVRTVAQNRCKGLWKFNLARTPLPIAKEWIRIFGILRGPSVRASNSNLPGPFPSEFCRSKMKGPSAIQSMQRDAVPAGCQLWRPGAELWQGVREAPGSLRPPLHAELPPWRMFGGEGLPGCGDSQVPLQASPSQDALQSGPPLLALDPA